jgi:hypothetical protein
MGSFGGWGPVGQSVSVRNPPPPPPPTPRMIPAPSRPPSPRPFPRTRRCARAHWSPTADRPHRSPAGAGPSGAEPRRTASSADLTPIAADASGTDRLQQCDALRPAQSRGCCARAWMAARAHATKAPLRQARRRTSGSRRWRRTCGRSTGTRSVGAPPYPAPTRYPGRRGIPRRRGIPSRRGIPRRRGTHGRLAAVRVARALPDGRHADERR